MTGKKENYAMPDDVLAPEGLEFTPQIWPICDEPGCNTPFVHRRCISFDPENGGLSSGWVWQRDCKHKKAGMRTNVEKGTHQDHE